MRLKNKLFRITAILSLLIFVSTGCSKSDQEIKELEKRIFDQTSKIRLDEYVSGPVYVVFRDNGEKQDEMWTFGENWEKNLHTSVKTLIKNRNYPNSIEICIPTKLSISNFRSAYFQNWNVYRGVKGVQFEYKGVKKAVCPTQMIADNQSFREVLQDYMKTNGLDIRDIRSMNMKIFDAKQYLLTLADNNGGSADSVREMFRGNNIVNQSEVTKESVEILADGMAGWLLNNLNDNGRLMYKYWPSKEEESSSNNMIRQFMGTAAIGRWARHTGNSDIYKRQKKNLKYNFDRYFEDEDEIGFIEYRNKRKLGAAALAGLAIIESDNYKYFNDIEIKLRNLTYRMWNEDGSFNTFYNSDRNDNHNFYPGEALLYWSIIYQQNEDPELLRKFFKSFHYYKKWHLQHRNPAFIPWHTQAYYNMWLKTGNQELKDFIFLMNDWLIEKMQKYEIDTYEDTVGRFYSSKEKFGVPHASSTGVYLEGLIDAYKLAKKTGDQQRAEEYRKSILKGLRSVMQLQFTDDIDTYYISRKEKVMGGIRTTVYDNEIRVDNVQHNLMGVIKILEEFDEKDFIL